MSDPVEASRSMFNPQDVAVKMQRGDIPREGMTIGQFLQQMGVSMNDPVQVALDKIKQNAMNASPQGKISSMGQSAGGSPAGAPMGGGAPPMGAQPAPRPGGQGLAGLMGR